MVLTVVDEPRFGDSETDGHSKLLCEARGEAVHSGKARSIRGTWKVKKMQNIYDQCMKAKMELLERTRDMGVDELLLHGFSDKWTATRLRELLKRDVNKCKLLVIFVLEEDHIPAEEGRVGKKEIQKKKSLEAVNMQNTVPEIKETENSYSQVLRGCPVMITFSME